MTEIQAHHEKVLVIDFGSQVTQLIARRLRESGVYCEVHPFNRVDDAFLDAYAPQAIILSGGPNSVHGEGTPRAAQSVFERGLPVLGICYGQQTLCTQIGGSVEAAITANSAAPTSRFSKPRRCSKASGKSARNPVWMSHGDRVTRLPEGFEVIGTSPNAPFAISRRREAALLHHHVPPRSGAHARRRETPVELRAQDRGLKSDWSMAAYRAEMARRSATRSAPAR
jgi:GMP synthase (glutamine-hydrolysing)